MSRRRDVRAGQSFAFRERRAARLCTIRFSMRRAKLVRVVRRRSVRRGRRYSQELAELRQVGGRERCRMENHRQLWVPPGFAHGFVVLSESAQFLYKTTDYWFPEHERSIRLERSGDRHRMAD